MNGPSRVVYENKAWGRTAFVTKKPGFTVHHLVVVPGSYCSIHLHERRFNGFFVTKGQMFVKRFYGEDPDGEPIFEAELKAGDYFEVAPGVRHQFRSVEGCEALEIYFPPDVLEEDIKRFSVGGLEPV